MKQRCRLQLTRGSTGYVFHSAMSEMVLSSTASMHCCNISNWSFSIYEARVSVPHGSCGPWWSSTSISRKCLDVCSVEQILLWANGTNVQEGSYIPYSSHFPWALQVDNRDFLLKNFLLLVLLLDKVHTDPDVKLPQSAPPLFDVKAKHKSSKEVSNLQHVPWRCSGQPCRFLLL